MIGNNPKDIIKPTNRLSYELVHNANLLKIPMIFKDDDNPFVIQAYKDVRKIKTYYKKLASTKNTDPNLIASDWLIKLKEKGTYIGIISIYDLSDDIFQDQHIKCSLGFAIRTDHQRQYYATEAINHFLDFINTHLERKLVIAYTQDGNTGTKSLLQKLGFEDVTHAYVSGPDVRYYQKDLGKKWSKL